MNEENLIKDYEEYKKIFLKDWNELNDNSIEEACKISFVILQNEKENLLKQIKELKRKNKEPNKKKKKVKFDKRIENKICKLILTYRKTSKEIKQIILEENNIKISDRDLINLKKKKNIKGYSIVK